MDICVNYLGVPVKTQEEMAANTPRLMPTASKARTTREITHCRRAASSRLPRIPTSGLFGRTSRYAAGLGIVLVSSHRSVPPVTGTTPSTSATATTTTTTTTIATAAATATAATATATATMATATAPAPVATAPIATAPFATAPIATAPIATAPIATAPIATAPIATTTATTTTIATLVVPDLTDRTPIGRSGTPDLNRPKPNHNQADLLPTPSLRKPCRPDQHRLPQICSS